jgi:hypothetical protein
MQQLTYFNNVDRVFLTFLIFSLQFIIFDLQESLKYLITKCRDEEAVQVSIFLPKL